MLKHLYLCQQQNKTHMKSKLVVDYLDFVHKKKKSKESLGVVGMDVKSKFIREMCKQMTKTLKPFGWEAGIHWWDITGTYDNLIFSLTFWKEFPHLNDYASYRFTVNIYVSYLECKKMLKVVEESGEFNNDIKEMFHLQCVGWIDHDDMIEGVYKYYTKNELFEPECRNDWGICEFRFDDSKYPYDTAITYNRQGRELFGVIPTFSEVIKKIETLYTEHIF